MILGLCTFLDHHGIDYTLNESVKRLSYVGIGGTVALAAYPKNRGELLCLLSRLVKKGIPYKVVGNMSNVLPPDGEWKICLISTQRMRNVYFEQGMAVAECGAPLSLLCHKMLDYGLAPPVMLMGIPATVGGAVFQNAGAYGLSISERLAFVDIYDPREDRVVRADRAQMAFSYRRSDISERGILLSAGIIGGNETVAASKQAMAQILERRRMSQPSERSLGSVFLRVGEKSAAYYIDQCGLKGCRIGGASVSQKHAGFIINEGNASAKDFRALIDFVRMRVKERFCVVLQTEIEIIEETEEARWLRFV